MPEVVVSVPHSGTRTLVQHLRVDATAQWLPGGRYWHFGNSEGLLKRRNIHAHIPVRNPYDVARSWGQRDKTGDVLAAMLRAYAHMFRFVEAPESGFTLHHIERLPVLDGAGEHPGAPLKSPKIQKFQDAVRREVVEPHMGFFTKFYSEEELHAQA